MEKNQPFLELLALRNTIKKTVRAQSAEEWIVEYTDFISTEG